MIIGVGKFNMKHFNMGRQRNGIHAPEKFPKLIRIKSSKCKRIRLQSGIVYDYLDCMFTIIYAFD